MVDNVKDPTSISVLLKKYGVTDEDINKALLIVKDQQDLLLGETLVELDVISEEILKDVLIYQEALRSKGKYVSKLLDQTIQRVIDRGDRSSQLNDVILNSFAFKLK